MTAYIIKRLIQTVFILIIVSFIAFMLIQSIPGDPALTMLGSEATQGALDKLRRELWLDRPLTAQYGRWVSNILHGNFGTSIIYRERVTSLIATHLPVTLHLGLLALCLSTLVGIMSGVISAVRRGRFVDSAVTLIANLGLAVPEFWLGILCIYLFGLKLGWLPMHGYTFPWEDFWLSTKKVIMPVMVLAVFPIATTARQTRSSMLEVIRQEYIRTAYSKGLTERAVIVGHALKNSLIPVITLLGLQIRTLVGGAVLVETVFNIPGMGRLIVRAALDNDFVIVQGCIMVIALAVASANLLVDISYGWLDPRIRYD